MASSGKRNITRTGCQALVPVTIASKEIGAKMVRHSRYVALIGISGQWKPPGPRFDWVGGADCYADAVTACRAKCHPLSAYLQTLLKVIKSY